MNAERLLNAARAVRETNFPLMFTMHGYVHKCGSPGCVLGNYAARADLQSAFAPEELDPSLGDVNYGRFKTGIKTVEGVPVDWYSLEVQRHFDLTRLQCEQLFGYAGCDNAQTPEEAADYIERFVKLRRYLDSAA